MHFYIWVNYINPHQSSFINALAAREGDTVTLLPETTLLPKRALTKWAPPILNNVNVSLSPDDSLIKNIIFQSDENSMHIFHGMHYPKQIPKALRLAQLSKKRIAIWSEPYNYLGLKGKFRYLRSLYNRIKYDKGIDFILTTGNKGVELLQKAGHPTEKIYDWGYFTEVPAYNAPPSSDTFNIGFAGFLIHRKGVDYLLHAMAKIKKENICVNIVGEGPEKKGLELIIKKYALRNINFQNFISPSEVSQFMAKQDLFVLPSRFDGWGAVVNEALMQGTPVISSDNCGASVLLNQENFSSTFKTGSIDILASQINHRIEAGKLKEEERKKIKEWSKCISGESAATYFRQIVEHVYNNCERPKPPWSGIGMQQ